MPRISVIIPNYNHANYLTQRIDSVLNQSYQDFELIILDDCSTDNSRQIIDSYSRHPKVTGIVYNDKNSGGPFKQWEKGISMAKGEYVWIAESDDWCEATLLEELILALDNNQNCVISYCQSYCVQNTNLIIWQSQNNYLSEYIDGQSFIAKYMLTNNKIYNASMVLWKKNLFQSIPKEFINYKFCGDWLFWIELAKHGEIHISGRLLNYFRKHDNDISGKASESGLEFIETLNILKTLYHEQLIRENQYKKILKNHLKNFWKQKPQLDPNVNAEISLLFKSLAPSKISYYKLLISVIWNISKRKK